MERQLGAGVLHGPTCVQSVIPENSAICHAVAPAASSHHCPVSPRGRGGVPCAIMCTEVPTVAGNSRFVPYEINPCPFLLGPQGLGNCIGDTIFFVYDRKIMQAGRTFSKNENVSHLKSGTWQSVALRTLPL